MKKFNRDNYVNYIRIDDKIVKKSFKNGQITLPTFEKFSNDLNLFKAYTYPLNKKQIDNSTSIYIYTIDNKLEIVFKLCKGYNNFYTSSNLIIINNVKIFTNNYYNYNKFDQEKFEEDIFREINKSDCLKWIKSRKMFKLKSINQLVKLEYYTEPEEL